MIKASLHRYSFYCIDNRRLLKTLREKKKLLVTSNFFFSHNDFHSIRKFYPHLSIFLTSYFYLLLNLKSLKLTCWIRVKALPRMLSLGSSNSAANKDRMSKILTNGGYNFLSRKHCGKRRKCLLLAISSFSQYFQKLSVVETLN